MSYVDGFVIPLPKTSVAAYRKIARDIGKIWREHGALDYREFVADDAPVGKLTSFPRSVKMKPAETVVFAYILYKSRKHRDQVNAKVMKDKRSAKYMQPGAVPFDTKRMIFGGFKSIVEL